MIKVDDEYIIEIDSCNYIPKIDKKKEYVDKDGNTRHAYDIVGYFGTLKSAIEGVRQDKIRRNLSANDYDLISALAEIGKIDYEFKETLEKAVIV